MDNASRSEKSRNAILQAALAIIARDGAGRLTLDAIARESGISKGGLMHQFHNKEAVLKALLQHQIEQSESFSRRYLAEHGATQAQPHLATQIATLRDAISQPRSVFLAILGAVAQDPSLLAVNHDRDAETRRAIAAEASDPDLALLRWAAAWGLTFTALLGQFPLSDRERERLFDRLLDDRQWPPLAVTAQPREASPPRPRGTRKR